MHAGFMFVQGTSAGQRSHPSCTQDNPQPKVPKPSSQRPDFPLLILSREQRDVVTVYRFPSAQLKTSKFRRNPKISSSPLATSRWPACCYLPAAAAETGQEKSGLLLRNLDEVARMGTYIYIS